MTCGTRFGCSFGRATDWQWVVQWLRGLRLKHVDVRRPRPPLSWAVRGSWNLVAIFALNHCELNASRVKTPHSHRHHPSDAGSSPKGSHRRIKGLVKAD